MTTVCNHYLLQVGPVFEHSEIMPQDADQVHTLTSAVRFRIIQVIGISSFSSNGG